MNVTEFIGFIVSFGLFIYMMIRQALVTREKKKHPVQPDEDDDELRHFLRELDIDEEEEEELPEEIKPKPKPKVLAPKPRPIYHPPPLTPIAPMPGYEVENKKLPSRSENLLHELPDPKNMLIYYEIFGPPKSLRKD